MSEVNGTRVSVQTTKGFGSWSTGQRWQSPLDRWRARRHGRYSDTHCRRRVRVLLAAGYNIGGMLMRAGNGGDGIDVEKVYSANNRALANKHGGIASSRRLRLYCDKEDSGTPGCVEFKTGKQMRRGRGKGTGSTVGDRRRRTPLSSFCRRHDRPREVATPKAYEPVSTFKVPHAGIQPGWVYMIACRRQALYPR